jgi:hypothetical protein
MRHPTDGTLRRLLDEPAGVADTDREHIAGCPACLAGLSTARQDAALTFAALHVDHAVDVDAAWSRLSRAAAADDERQAPVASDERRPAVAARPRRWREALRSPVIAVVGAVAILGGASAAAANDWLQVFRTEQITPVTISEADLLTLPDLSAYGDVRMTQAPDIREVADAAAAEKASGLPVPQVGALPRGVTGAPVYRAAKPVKAVFTFSVEKAARTAAETGKTLPPPPPGLDGSQVLLSAGPGHVAVWSEARGLPALVVARTVAPTASYSSGLSFETARDYLLTLPGLPENVAAQLRAFSGDGTTLPLPVNAGELTSATADVGGVPATVLTSKDSVLAGVVWVQDGVVTAVAGSLSADEVLSVARGLRSR